MKFTEYTIERINDPFGILSGERYEFFIHFEVDEDDELYSENGLQLKVLWIVEEISSRIAHYHILDAEKESVLDFELEDEELAILKAFCQEHYLEADTE